MRRYQLDVVATANAFRLGQVFVNLLVNAADAVDDAKASSNEIELETRVDAAGRVLVDVIDHGTGIPKAIQERIFEPFFTTKPIGKGTGLGLSVCQAIVTSFGGRITCESAPGRTVFRVALPAAAGGVSEKRAKAPEVKAAPHGGRVLVVDDDPSVASAVARVLDEHDVGDRARGSRGARALSRRPLRLHRLRF